MNARLNTLGLVGLYAAFGTLLVICDQAKAGPSDPTWNPPARYDHAYTGNLTIHRVPVGQVDEACIAMYKANGHSDWAWQVKANQHGCTIAHATSCEVIIPTGPIMHATPKAILRHEVGHCNGWTGKHEE